MNRPVGRIRTFLLALLVALPLLVGAAPDTDPGATAAPGGTDATVASASGFRTFIETDSPACLPVLGGDDVTAAPYFADGDCGYTRARLSGVPDGATVAARMVGPGPST